MRYLDPIVGFLYLWKGMSSMTTLSDEQYALLRQASRCCETCLDEVWAEIQQEQPTTPDRE